MVTHADVTVTRNANGSLTLAAMKDGYRVSETYYGYTTREARRAFHQQVNLGQVS